MNTNTKSNKVTAAVTTLITFFMSVPIQASDCIPTESAPVKTGNLKQAVNYLQNKNNCNGIISRQDELDLLKQVGSVNEKYLYGETDLKERGADLSALIESTIKKEKLTGDDAKQARAEMLNYIFGDSNSIKQNVTNYAHDYQKSHPGSSLPAGFVQGLARLGVVSNVDQHVQTNGGSQDNMLKALSSAGVTQNSKGSWDYSAMKVTVQGLKNNGTLSMAIGTNLGVPYEMKLRDPNRTTIVPAGDVVFLPPKADGTIPVANAAKWENNVKISMTNLQTAIGSYLSNAQAENTTGHSVQRALHEDQNEVGARKDAEFAMSKEVDYLKSIGYPNEGLATIQDSINKAKQTGAQLDSQGAQKLQALEKAIKVTVGISAGVGILAGLSKMGELSEAAAEVGELAKGAKTTKNVMEGMASATRGIADYQKVVRNAMSTATAGNMVPAALMPFGFSTVGTMINAGVDLASGKGIKNTFCSMTTDMTDKLAQNLLMANFAYAVPLSSAIGGAAEVASKGKMAAETVAAVTNAGQSTYFVYQGGKSATPELKKCAQSLDGNATSDDVTESHAANAAKTCLQAGFDTGNALWMAGHAFHSTEDLNNGNTQTRADNVTAAKDRAATGLLRKNDTFSDADGAGYRVLDSGYQNGKGTVVAMNEKTNQIVSIPADKLKDGKAKMSFKVDNEKLALAQAKYDDLAGPTVKSEDSVATAPTAEDNSVGTLKLKDPKIAALAKKDAKVLNQYWKSIKEGITHNDAKLNDNISMDVVLDNFSSDELTKRDKKIELEPKAVKEMLTQARFKCMGEPVGSNNQDNSSWDVAGNFVGILYAQNETGCELFDR
jgi:hypothetical protein